MFITKIKSHFNRSQITSVKKKATVTVLFYTVLISSSFITSCDKQIPDQQTLHFTTRDGIKTSLDLELEIYRADEDPNLFYINSRYYTKNKNGQWSVSSKPEGPWKTFPDQHMAPEGLRLLKN